MIYHSICEMIGNTPLLELAKYENKFGLNSIILAKIEKGNPAGSVKDRAALKMIEDYEQKGLLKKGYTIIEPTSGNTGIGIAAISAAKGYNAIIVMPNSMSKERINLMKAYGATVILTDGALGMKGAISKANEINLSTKNSIIAGQFENPSNPMAHYLTTGPEIWNDTNGKIDYFVAGIGTGGTISGVGKYLKEKNPNIKIIGVEPLSSPFINKGISGKHKIQGIGAGFIPKNYDNTICDEVIMIEDNDSYTEAQNVAKTEGLFVGISSGAALMGAKIIAQRDEAKGKTIVCLFPDGGDRYLSVQDFIK